MLIVNYIALASFSVFTVCGLMCLYRECKARDWRVATVTAWLVVAFVYAACKVAPC